MKSLLVAGLLCPVIAFAQEPEWRMLRDEARSVWDQRGGANADRAIEIEKRALESLKSEFPENHRDVVNLTSDLGVMYLVNGRYADAEPLLLGALAICEKEFSAPDGYTMVALDNLGVLYRFQKQYSKAETFKERALGVYEQMHGKNAPSIVPRLTSLAALYREAGHDAKARDVEARIEAIKAGK